MARIYLGIAVAAKGDLVDVVFHRETLSGRSRRVWTGLANLRLAVHFPAGLAYASCPCVPVDD